MKYQPGQEVTSKNIAAHEYVRAIVERCASKYVRICAVRADMTTRTICERIEDVEAA